MKSITQTAMCFHQFREIKIIGCCSWKYIRETIQQGSTKLKALHTVIIIMRYAIVPIFLFEVQNGQLTWRLIDGRVITLVLGTNRFSLPSSSSLSSSLVLLPSYKSTLYSSICKESRLSLKLCSSSIPPILNMNNTSI